MNVYSELQETTDAAYATFCDAAMAAFDRLGQFDPELMQIAKDAYGSSSLAAVAFARPAGWDHRSHYARLAAGERDEIRGRMIRAMHGMF